MAPEKEGGSTPAPQTPDDGKQRAEGLLESAKAAEATGEWEKARNLMTQAIELFPKDANFHARMGWYSFRCPSLSIAERERLAQHHLEYALDLNPVEHQAHYYFGLFWLNKGNPIRARRELDSALRTAPDFKPAREAIDMMEGKRAPSMSKLDLPRVSLKRVNTRLIVLGVIVAAMGAAYLGIETARSRGGEFDRKAESLGTSLEISDVSEGPGVLYIETGTSWEKLPQADRQRQMEIIAASAAKQGLTRVSVFSKGNQVGAVVKNQVCATPHCLNP